MPRGCKHISFVFWSAFWDKIVMGKKIFVLCLDVIMIAFFWFSIRNMVFHCVFLGKRRSLLQLYIQTQHRDDYYQWCNHVISMVCSHRLWLSTNQSAKYSSVIVK